MTTARSEIIVPPGFRPRLLPAEAAALYVGFSPNAFTARVGTFFPKPLVVDGKRVWDVRDLDDAIDRLKGGQSVDDPWE